MRKDQKFTEKFKQLLFTTTVQFGMEISSIEYFGKEKFVFVFSPPGDYFLLMENISTNREKKCFHLE